MICSMFVIAISFILGVSLVLRSINNIIIRPSIFQPYDLWRDHCAAASFGGGQPKGGFFESAGALNMKDCGAFVFCSRHVPNGL